MQLRQPGVLLGLRLARRSATCAAYNTRPLDPKERTKLLGDIAAHAGHRLASTRSCSTRRRSAVANKGLKGLWGSSPIFANDMSAVSWQ